MFIDQMTLFILAEVAVVYVIMTVFLFFRQRLYHVLVAILKEMRWEKLRRQQERQREIAALRAQNKQLSTDYLSAKRTAESAGKTIPEQLRDRVDQLEEDAREAGTDPEQPPGPGDDDRLGWMRRRILELEQRLLAGDITEDQWREEAAETLLEAGMEPGSAGRKNLAGSQLQLEQLEKERDQYRNQYEAARDRISFLEKELEEIKSIDAEAAPQMERPQPGQYADELYRLKCDKFDMQESINQLRLKLQQLDPDSAEFIEAQQSQMQNMERYIKDADVTMNLLEKEMEASHHENSALEEEVHSLKNRLKDLMVEEGKASSPVNRDNVNQLSDNTSKQAESVSNLRDSIDQLREGGDRDQVAEYQEGEIGRLELLVRDSESCIGVLELELEQAQATIGQLSEREQELLRQLEAGGADSAEVDSTALPERIREVGERQKSALEALRTQAAAVRDGEDTATVAKRQQAEIDSLQHLLGEMESLVAGLQRELEESESAPAPAKAAEERPDSNEDIEEMESLLRQFMSDSQSMMNRLKELEEENQRLKTPEPARPSPESAE